MPKREVFEPDWPRLAGRGRSYSPAVKKGNLLFISGMTSYDREGNKVGSGDVVAQTRQIFENMKDVLETAGATFDDVVKTVDYIVPEALQDYRATGEIRREYFKDNFWYSIHAHYHDVPVICAQAMILGCHVINFMNTTLTDHGIDHLNIYYQT